MRLVVLIITAACAGCARTATIDVRAQVNANHNNLSETLFWASVNASGARLCDRAKSKEYQTQFDGRYGRRVRALLAEHEARYGRDPPFIEISSCERWTGDEISWDFRHQQAMDQFEYWLRAAERDARRR
jgi:hypothetical protein